MDINHYKNNIGYGNALQKSEKIASRERNVKERVKLVKKFLKPANRKKVLEIGSHEGLFLKELKDLGYEVLGVEPGLSVARHAKSIGINTLEGSFEEVFPNIKEKFDAVFLFHTLEHMEDALSNLKKIKTIINPQGFIFIEVPNILSYRSRKYGENWEYIYSEHLHYFSCDSLSKLLSEAGFKVKKNYFRDFDDSNMSLKQSLDRLIFFKFFKNQKEKHSKHREKENNAGLNLAQIKNKKKFIFLNFLRKFFSAVVTLLKRGDFILTVAVNED